MVSVNLQHILFLVTDCFSVIGNTSLLSDLPPWENSTDVVRVFYAIFSPIFVVFRVRKCVEMTFIVAVSAVGECHLGLSVQGSVSEVRRGSGGGGL